MHFSAVTILSLAGSLQLWASASAAPPPADSSPNSASLNMFSQELNLTAPFNTTLLDLSNSATLNAPNRDFPDPYDFIVANNKLTIEFYGYQGSVNFTNMNNCVRNANRAIIHKIMAGQESIPVGTGPYVWSSGDVALYLSPEEQLTWASWSLAPVAIEKFIAENELRGTQFILLWHELGPVGYGQLVSTTEVQSLTSIAAAYDAFPDPYDKEIASIGLTIEFYGYRGSISPTAMRDCISAASNDVVQHLLVSEAAMSIEAPSYTYSAGGVDLFLSPTEHLTWHMWAFVPIWIQEFVTENESKGTQFIVLWEGLGPVGYGQLLNSSTNTPTVPSVGVF